MLISTPPVIKLADYLLVDTLHMLALNSVKDISEEVRTDTRRNVPLLKVEVVLEDDLQFSPNFSKFNTAMESTISGFVDTIVSVPKLISYVSLAFACIYPAAGFQTLHSSLNQ